MMRTDRIARRSVRFDRADYLEEIQNYLELRALQENASCWAYMPSQEAADIKPLQRFVDANRLKFVGNSLYELSLLRRSIDPVVALGGVGALHLDSVDSSGLLPSSEARQNEGDLFRLVVNLHPGASRRVGFCFQYPGLSLDEYDYGFRATNSYDRARYFELEINPQTGNEFDALEFCASSILHAGLDDKHGHFVALYHRIEV